MHGAYVAIGTGLILCSLVRIIWPPRWATTYLQTGQLTLPTASLVMIAIGGSWQRDLGLAIQVLLSAGWLASAVLATQKWRSTPGRATAVRAMQRGHLHIWAEAVSCGALLLIIAHGTRAHFATAVALSTSLALSAAIAASVRLEKRKDAATVSEWLASRRPTPSWPGRT
jgi:hypothetical protein